MSIKLNTISIRHDDDETVTHIVKSQIVRIVESDGSFVIIDCTGATFAFHKEAAKKIRDVFELPYVPRLEKNV